MRFVSVTDRAGLDTYESLVSLSKFLSMAVVQFVGYVGTNAGPPRAEFCNCVISFILENNLTSCLISVCESHLNKFLNKLFKFIAGSLNSVKSNTRVSSSQNFLYLPVAPLMYGNIYLHTSEPSRKGVFGIVLGKLIKLSSQFELHLRYAFRLRENGKEQEKEGGSGA